MEAEITEQKQKRPLYKRLMRITSISIGVISFFIALLIFLAWAFEDQIAKYAIDQLNKKVNTNIQYKELSFSLISRFPMGTLQFTDVKVQEVVKTSKKGDLLRAKNIFIEFNAWDMITGNYAIRKVEIEQARIRLKMFADGSDNFQIFKPSQDTSSSDFKMKLNSIKFKDVDFGFADYSTLQHYRILLKSAKANGDFSSEIYSFNLSGSVFLYDISYDSIQYIKNKDAEVKLQFDVNSPKGSYMVKNGKLSVNKIPFKVDGVVIYSDAEKSMDYTISGDKLKLHSFIEELPPTEKAYFSKFESTGDLKFNLKIKGSLSDPTPLSILLTSELKNGKIVNKQNNLSLDDVNFAVKYTNGSKGTMSSSGLSFSNFSARLKSGIMKGKFSVNNLDRPKIETDLKGEINLEDLAQFLKADAISSMSGKLTIDSKIKINLRSWSQVTANDFLNSETSGKISITNGKLKLKDYPLPIMITTSDLTFNKSNIIINQMEGTIGKSDYSLDGSFVNILPYFFLNQQQIQIDATLTSNYLNFDELLKSDNKKSETGKSISFSPDIKFNIKLKNKHLKFGKFEPNDISATLKMNDRVLQVSGLNMSIFGGKISASGSINGRATNKKLLSTVRGEINGVNVSKLFYSFNNFGQEADGLTDKNLNGTIDCKITMSATWNQDLTPDMELLKASVDVTVENGELNNYQTLNALARFIKVEDLQQVRFKKLTNKFEIYNQKIVIPEMEIQSNAINLKLSGIHYFDQRMDYHVKIRLSELLSKKAKSAKKENDDFGEIEDDGLERTTIYLLVTGNTDNPIVKYDTKEARQKIAKDIKNEKLNIKQILNKEFGKSKGDTISKKKQQETDKQKQKEKDNVKKQENGKFVIEWED
jgi:hypothetical protein